MPALKMLAQYDAQLTVRHARAGHVFHAHAIGRIGGQQTHGLSDQRLRLCEQSGREMYPGRDTRALRIAGGRPDTRRIPIDTAQHLVPGWELTLPGPRGRSHPSHKSASWPRQPIKPM